jgi:hypothetical protein
MDNLKAGPCHEYRLTDDAALRLYLQGDQNAPHSSEFKPSRKTVKSLATSIAPVRTSCRLL